MNTDICRACLSDSGLFNDLFLVCSPEVFKYCTSVDVSSLFIMSKIYFFFLFIIMLLLLVICGKYYCGQMQSSKPVRNDEGFALANVKILEV